MQLNPSEISELIKSRIQNLEAGSELRTQGTVVSVTDGICRVHGLSDVMQGEMIEFPGNTFGLALNLERDSVGAVVLGEYEHISEGDTVKATYHQALALSLDMVQGTGVNQQIVTVSANRAPVGAMPSGAVEEKVEMIGTILAVDKAKRTVLVQGAVHHVTLQIPADMDVKDLKAGDQVRATYTQELAVAVEPTGTRPFSSSFESKRN